MRGRTPDTALTMTHRDAPYIRFCFFWDEVSQDVGIVTIRNAVPTLEYLPPAEVAKQFNLTSEEMNRLQPATPSNVTQLHPRPADADVVLQEAINQYDQVVLVGRHSTGWVEVAASAGLTDDEAIGVLSRGQHHISTLIQQEVQPDE